MATLLTEGFGNESGTSASKFKAYAGIRYSEADPSKGYYIQIRRYLLYYPPSGYSGGTGFAGTTFTRNWGDNFQVYGNDNNDGGSKVYADSDWVNVGWIEPGKSYSLTATCGYVSSSMGTLSSTKTVSITVPTTKTVTYNANGGTGAPSAQKGWISATITLSSTKPTRTGYTFLGWATSTNGTVAYAAGANYTSTASVTLYAAWKVNAPAAPTACTNMRNSDTKNTVTWTRGSQADATYSSIKVERSVNGGSWAEIASVAGTATSYTDTSTSANNYYRYRVRAYNSTGYSDYATSDYVYNTPSAPQFKSVVRTAETTVQAALTNGARTATALEIQRSTDKASWTSLTSVSGSAVTSFTDTPGGGTFYYRARNVRGSLASDWAYSEAVVTICAPNPPVLGLPSSSAVIPMTQAAVGLTWNHSSIDGSAQTEAQVRYSTDGGSTWTVIDISGAVSSLEVANEFSLNDTVTWSARTKGAADDYGEWAANRIFYVRQVPTLSFAAPTDGFIIETTPVSVEVSYTDPSGNFVAATFEILGEGGNALFSKSIASESDLVFTVGVDEWQPVNGQTYTFAITARSSSTLTATVELGGITVDFLEPNKAYLSIDPDPETGEISIKATYGLDSELAAIERLMIHRVYKVRGRDELRVLIADNVVDGQAIIDLYAPCNIPVTYEATTIANSGAFAVNGYEGEMRTPFCYFLWNGQLARLQWSIEDQIDVSRPSRTLKHRAGRKDPVLHDRGHVGFERSVSGVLLNIEEAWTFANMVEDSGKCVYKSRGGDVYHAAVEASIYEENDPACYGRADCSVIRIAGGAL